MRINREIISDLKGKRVLQKEPIDATSWAFMKLLREQDRTKRIYEEDPYVEVYQLRENVYGLLTINADGMGDPWMYLILGPERALLIDTSFGIGDLKGLVQKLAGKREIIVANTHCSFDHSYGNCQFERCYCHENEAVQMEEKQDPHIWDYLFDEQGHGIWMDFPKEDIIPFSRYEVIGVPDGYTFSLGAGYEVELIWVPGHKPGHAMYLDKSSRLLFAGDDVISMRVGIGTGCPFATVEAYRDGMVKLEKRMDEFDFLFPGHFIFDLEKTVIPSLIETAEKILESPEGYDYAEDARGKRTLQKFVKGLGTIGYHEKNVWEAEEKKA